MTSLELSQGVLSGAGFSTSLASLGDRPFIIFEDAVVVGFLFSYSNCADLIDGWSKDMDTALSTYQHALRTAGRKAWNAYTLLITPGVATTSQAVALSAIEEDLTGTRKIARAGVVDKTDIEAALLPLMALQAAPRLEAVDIAAEIRQRTTELPSRVVDAFLSEADEAVVLRVLEETP